MPNQPQPTYASLSHGAPPRSGSLEWDELAVASARLNVLRGWRDPAARSRLLRRDLLQDEIDEAESERQRIVDRLVRSVTTFAAAA